MGRQPLDLLIWGSCVSRDAVPFFPSRSVDLRCYVARQSLISAGKPVPDPQNYHLKFPTKFRQRMYLSDLAGDAVGRITRAAADCENPLVLLDLVDERGGFLEGPEGAVVTCEPEAAGHGIQQVMGDAWEHHPFSSFHYFLRLAESLTTLKAQLAQNGLWERTYVLPARWAEVDDNGEPTRTRLFRSVKAANEQYEYAYSMLAEAGWKFLPGTGIDPVADSAHKWGPAPFHYTNDFYQGVVAGVLGIS